MRSLGICAGPPSSLNPVPRMPAADTPSSSPAGDVTALLDALSGGNRSVVDAILPHVYDELRGLARRALRGERNGHTLNTTALVHEAYERMVQHNRMTWQNRAHFLGIAALSMRRILLNYARDRVAQKRGGDAPVATFEDGMAPRSVQPEELIDLDGALHRLHALNERQARVVTYRFFGGLTQREIAEILDVSEPTVRRDWRLARAWLSRELGRS